ncbi:MAG: AmmeMemoRadiSam system protein B, partial [Spirochaetales bacterium]
EAIEQEHAIELLLPYVRHTLPPEAELAAFLVPQMSSITAADSIAAALESWMQAEGRSPDRTLVLVSSDFSHYGERFGYTPYGTHPVSDVEDRVARDDQALAASVADLDADALWQRLSRPISVCGRYPMLVATRLFSRLHYRGKSTLYYNSNAFRASESDFVCYATVLFSGRRV